MRGGVCCDNLPASDRWDTRHHVWPPAAGLRQLSGACRIGNAPFVKLASLHGIFRPVMSNEAKQSSNLSKVVTRLESKTISGQFVLPSPDTSIVVGRQAEQLR